MSTDPERTLHHAVDVTADDVWAIADFLTPRLEALERTHHDDTEEHRTAAALAEAVSALVMALDAQILGPPRGRIRNRPAAPPAASTTLTTDEWLAAEKQRLTVITECWNQLCGILHPWRECDGYDRARWHRVTFLDAAAEAEYHRLVDEAGLRRAKRP